ncbi:MAG TPA: bifunctional UDP-N-acetylmuramoyl-tripeptide:D-alanyl-D-alanine ligase/alanine racemase [Cyclobacteriaceae bacterium]|nr:bifunctional UDP-N-acetylmuramoyl-tripeptide:D-alanyl-D-alanine ligase/alanine racemase [Cyclobacteriaceae bacterium]
MPHQSYPVSLIAKIIKGDFLNVAEDNEVDTLITDSRKITNVNSGIFFAITGDRHDGHNHVHELYQKGLRNFVVEKNIALQNLEDANVLLVQNTVRALQLLAKYHRQQFNLNVIGITGSNAKTIVKEWLAELLSYDHQLIKNPGSYNSQIGVALAVWQIETQHDLGIFEAGISTSAEMERLEEMIQPDIGIFTNIGSAHDEGFNSQHQKIEEKLKLFVSSKLIIYCADHTAIHEQMKIINKKSLSWAYHEDADIKIVKHTENHLTLSFNNQSYQLNIPVRHKAMQENLLHCAATLIYLGKSTEQINERISKLSNIPMRLSLKRGLQGTHLIDDTYNNDLAGLQIALDYLTSFPHKKKTVILSDVLQSGLEEKQLYKKIALLINEKRISRLITVGPGFIRHKSLFDVEINTFISTEHLLQQIQNIQLDQNLVLIKGARPFAFERIATALALKTHQTVLEINVGAIIHNLNAIKAALNPGVKLMAMVKAFAYGSGIEEVASRLQYHGTDYFGVAYGDEGKQLRDHGITKPIMVMNPSADSLELCYQNHLEPEIYSLNLLHELLQTNGNRSIGIHLKLETGMNRLGLNADEIEEVINEVKQNKQIQIKSIFTHLAAAEDSAHDEFTQQQIERFEKLYQQITAAINYYPIKHVLNSSGIMRFPFYQFDMVRTGIALYGAGGIGNKINLQNVLTLKSIISQVKLVKQGESVGYGRMGKIEKDTRIATVAIGYADGFRRSLGNGKGKVWVNGKLAPVIGNVCMDMIMVDLSGIEADEGEEVIIFGNELALQQHALWANTIAYEIISGISERVKRVYFTDSF